MWKTALGIERDGRGSEMIKYDGCKFSRLTANASGKNCTPNDNKGTLKTLAKTLFENCSKIEFAVGFTREPLLLDSL